MGHAKIQKSLLPLHAACALVRKGERQRVHYSALDKDYRLQLSPCSSGLCMLLKFCYWLQHVWMCKRSPWTARRGSPRDEAGLNPDARALPPSTEWEGCLHLVALTGQLCAPLGRSFHHRFNFLPLGFAVTWLTLTALFKSRVLWSVCTAFQHLAGGLPTELALQVSKGTQQIPLHLHKAESEYNNSLS